MAKKQFKAESKRLLDLMVNSIYTHNEIFLRELISNASDATDKLYYNALKSGVTGIDRDSLTIEIVLDKENRFLTISDHGAGMSKEELENNLGTIAKSGSLAFKKQHGDMDDVDIIGQFGVGFYSAFMVSKKIQVLSKALDSDEAWLWESTGADGYTVTPAEKETCGTVVTLSIKDNSEENDYDKFLEPYTIKGLVKKYSDYIRYPIVMAMPKSRKVEGSEDSYESYMEEETLNSMIPIWKQAKSELTPEAYNQFYKEKFFAFEDPLRVIHHTVEGVSSYTALLYIPAHAPFNYYSKDFEKGLQLYSNGVLIMEKCADLLPDYFSFVVGLVDSQDLSLNISREMLQHDRQLKNIARILEKKIKGELADMLVENREGYENFFKNFGLQLKYGIYSSFGQKKELLEDLLLYYSSSEKKMVTLAEYVSRWQEGQKAIYYACGETVAKLDLLPQTERLKEQGYEILYLTDDMDEFVLKMMGTYQEKPFCSVSDADLGLASEAEQEDLQQQTEAHKDLLAFLQENLSGEVKEVRLSTRLKSHPVCLTTAGEVSLEMEKVLNAMPSEQKVKAERVLEINANHPVFQALTEIYPADLEKAKTYGKILYNQALLIEGLPIADPVAYANEVCSLMAK